MRRMRTWCPSIQCSLGAILLAVLAVMAACRKEDPGSPTDGQVINQLYTNRYFGLTVAFPPGWAPGEFKPTFVAPANAPSSAPTQPHDAQTYQLLLLSEKPLETHAQTNASLLVMAELMRPSTRVKDAKDYLARISQFMVDSSVAYRPVSPITETRLGGLPAFRMDFTARLAGNKPAWQSYVVAARKGYSLAFILSASSDAGMKRLDQILERVRFSN